MVADFRVTGADQIARAAKALKAEGEAGKAGRRELLRAMQRGTKDVRKDMQQAALTDLPKRGGLNREVADSKFSTRTRTTGNSVGVRIVVVGKKVRNIKAIDRGELRHPVFATGERSTWTWLPKDKPQSISPNTFTRPFEAAAPGIRRELLAAMEQVVHDIARRSR